MSQTGFDRTAVIDAPPLHTVDGGADDARGATSELLRTSEAPIVPVPVNRRMPTQFGPYRIVRELGAGGMGAVYEAEDARDGRRVALKVLSREALPDSHAVSRFQKEARLLAEVRHPHVTNLVDVGEEQGTCYLVMELVEGIDLKNLLRITPQLPERTALQIAAQVAEALCGAHARGIVHRDIKPGNILLAWPAGQVGGSAAQMAELIAAGAEPFVKLTDFGLARHIQQWVSLELTRTGTLLGTPYYIAPEQCTGVGEVRAGSDVYALGATLFEMLCGRPPFLAADPIKLISLHCFEDPPDLRKLNPAVSDGAARLVLKALAKQPESRHADAVHFLAELDQLLRGDIQQIELHPQLPAATGGVTEVCWEWDLESSPERLWPLASNTERINCAVGVPAVEYQTERDAHGALRKIGTFKLGWASMAWEEHPFEWVEGRRLGVLREFRNGPFSWFVSIVELSRRSDGGTHLCHTVRIATRGLLGRLLAHVELNIKGRRALDRVYRRMDAVACGRLRTSTIADPFAPPATLRTNVRQRFDARQDQLAAAANVDPEYVDHLLQYLQLGPAQELARIRPRALASRLRVSADRMIGVCLQACPAGLLEMHWDILCPTCRVPSTVLDTLRDLDRHSYCEACDLDFEVDFQNSVEMIFRVHPELRRADLKTYCIGGPEHAPHVVAQVRLKTHEAFELDLALEPGSYVLRGPGLPYTVRLDLLAGEGVGRITLSLGPAAPAAGLITLNAGRQLLLLENQFDRPLTVRLERTIPRADVVTAAQAARLPLFRRLFPDEIVSRAGLSTVAARTLLYVRVENAGRLRDRAGQTAASREIGERLQGVHDTVEQLGGEVVRTECDSLLAVFSESRAAVRVAAEIAAGACDAGPQTTVIALRAAVFEGTALSRTMNGRIDLLTGTASEAAGMLDRSVNAPLVLSAAVGDQPETAALLESMGFALQSPAGSAGEPADRPYDVLRKQTVPSDHEAGQ